MAEAILKQVPWYLYLVIIIAVGLAVAGFLVPPQGVIDGSVLKVIAELMGGSAVLEVVIKLPQYIEAGVKAQIAHGDTTITIGKDKLKKQE